MECFSLIGYHGDIFKFLLFVHEYKYMHRIRQCTKLKHNLLMQTCDSFLKQSCKHHKRKLDMCIWSGKLCTLKCLPYIVSQSGALDFKNIELLICYAPLGYLFPKK